MKCLLNPSTGEVRRVAEGEVPYLRSRGWEYCTKALWKSYRVTSGMLKVNEETRKVQRSIRRV